MQVSSTKPLNSVVLSAEDKNKKNLDPVKNNAQTDSSKSSPAPSQKLDAQGSSLRALNKQWSGLTEAQAKLSRLQSMSETFRYTQDALLGLAREMTSKLPQSAKILHEISVLKSKLSSQNQIDENFLPKTSTPKSSYKLSRMDLIASKDQNESIQIRLPDNSQVNFEISKYQSSDSIFKEIVSKFRNSGIKVEQNPDAKLIFTGPEKLMDSAWIFQGQGLRIPAGNPVPISLEKLPDPLTNLSEKVFQEDFENAKLQLREILADLSKKLKVVDRETDNLLTQNMTVSNEKSELALSSSEDLKKTISGDEKMAKIQALISQANVPREHVVDILSVD